MKSVRKEEEESTQPLTRDSFHSYLARAASNAEKFNLFGDIESSLCDQAVLFLHLASPSNPCTFYICSYGGSGDDGRALIGAMELAKAGGITIRTVALGAVFSAALDIFLAGTPGRRYVQQDCLMMAHSAGGDMKNKKEFKLRTEMDERILERYSKIRKPQREKMLENGDHYFGAEEAVSLGVADSIIRIGELVNQF